MYTIDFKSPHLIGLLHFATSLAFAFLTLLGGMLLSLFEVSPFNIIFGVWFETVTQSILTYAVCFGVGAGISITLYRSTNNMTIEDRLRIVRYSTYWFLVFWACIISFLYFSDQSPSYGVTPREEAYTNAMIAPLIIVEFYVITRSSLMKKKAMM